MLWRESGVWLETRGSDGVRRSDFCGRIPLGEVKEFCREHGLDLVLCETQDRRHWQESYGWESQLSPIAREELAARGH